MSARYDLESSPPPAVLLTAVAQHMGLMAVTLVFPLLVAQAAGAGPELQAHYLQLAMLAMGLGTLAQAFGRSVFGLPQIGSGFLLPAVFTAAYLPAALLVARTGGLEAVAGLTLVAGLTQMVLSRFISRLRPYLPVEIVGLSVLLIGIILGIVALKLIVGSPRGGSPDPQATGPALAALAVMTGLAVWGGARLRTVAVLLGLVAGVGLHLAVQPPATGLHFSPSAFLPHVIGWPLVTPKVELGLVPGFLAGALACTLRAFGDMVASQKINQPGWKRPDYANIEAGVLADGLGTFLAGVLGTMGLNTNSASVGLSVATGVRARRVALGVGLGWIVLAFQPHAAQLLLAVPRGVLGAALLFAATFVVMSGISILGQRLLDSRRTLVIGFALFLGLSFDEMPDLYARDLPPVLQPVITSSLVLGLLTALVLNALFRIGSRSLHRMHWEPASGQEPLRRFLDEVGGHEGVRADSVLRLTQLAEEFAEAAPHLSPAGPVAVVARFDEYALELTFAWQGRPLRPGPAPTLDDNVDEEAIMNGVVLALMTRLADRLATRTLAGGRQELTCRIVQ